MESIEGPLLKVPFEALKRVAKDRKTVVDEVTEVVAAVERAAQDESVTVESAQSTIDGLIDRLSKLKRKVQDSSEGEVGDAARCRARLRHLVDIGPPQKDASLQWNRHRMHRILVDYMLRRCYWDSASALTAASHIEDLVDVHVFDEARVVVSSLQRHDCSEALRWCARHRARLKKVKSCFEFRLRVQEFIELVAHDKEMEALKHARKHLAPFASQHLKEFQRAFAAIAFKRSTTCGVYAALFDEQRWRDVIELFMDDLYKLNAMTPQSLLAIHLQAGLSALKTPLSSDNCSREDPLHLPSFQSLASSLPYAKHDTTKLICCITKQFMDERNPPMVLPNGFVYSQRAIDTIAADNDGAVVCPKTGERFALDEVMRAYIV